jgi:hypothetical protein
MSRVSKVGKVKCIMPQRTSGCRGKLMLVSTCCNLFYVHGMISGVQAGVGMVARQIRYRTMYVQESKPVVGTIDST